ncbi:MAG TPA: single-stranded DNA-binding protein [Thermoleophilaceae bacterium]|jgi:single-stranded DNA-binding protein
MNTVSLIGTLTHEPRLRGERSDWECTLRLAVQRRLPDGSPEPGVVYIEAKTYGAEAREVAELHEGDKIGLSGRLDSDHPRDETPGWSGVLIDQLDYL